MGTAVRPWYFTPLSLTLGLDGEGLYCTRSSDITRGHATATLGGGGSGATAPGERLGTRRIQNARSRMEGGKSEETAGQADYTGPPMGPQLGARPRNNRRRNYLPGE